MPEAQSLRTSLMSRLPGPLASALRMSQTRLDIARNTGWLFADRLLRMLGALFVTAWVTRYLGPDLVGVLNYAGTLVAFVAPFVGLGLEELVARDLVRAPDDRDEILGTTVFLRSIAGLVGAVGVYGVAVFLQPNDRLVQGLTALLGSAMLFQSIDSIGILYRVRMQSKYPVYARNGAFVLASIAKVVIILMGGSVVAIAAATTAEMLVSSLGLLLVYRLTGERIARWRATWARARGLLAESWPLVVSTLGISVYMKIDAVMLGQMLGPHAVGIYSSATRLSEIWYFVPAAIAASASAAIVQAKAVDERLYYGRIQQLFNIMVALSVSIALVMTVSSRLVILTLFGEAFAASAPVLAIHIWAGVFVFLGVARSTWIVTERLTRAAIVFTSVGAVANIALNLVLIPRYAEIGAAIATVVSYAAADYLVFLVYRPFRKIGWMMTRSLFFRWSAPA